MLIGERSVEEVDRSFELSRRAGSAAWPVPDVALLEVGSDSRILHAAGTVEIIVGRRADELKGMSLRSLLPAREHPRLAALLAAAATVSTGAAKLTLLCVGLPVECDVFWWSTDAGPREGLLRALLHRR